MPPEDQVHTRQGSGPEHGRRVGGGALRVQVLGGFAVWRGDEERTIKGRVPEVAVKVVAAADGPVHVERLMETLWPGVKPRIGRRRLRNVLSRVRRASDELLDRQGEAITIGEQVVVDARRFERAADIALQAEEAGDSRAPVLARDALSHYTGEFLPTDPYAPWAALPRERLRQRHLRLLDVLSADAADKGRTGEAVRLIERAIQVDPLGEVRYVRAAKLLARQGRQAAARRMLDRAAAAVDELGVPPSPAHRALRERLGRRGR